MSQHFLLSAKARTLSLSAVLRMTDEEAETAFAAIRWADNGGAASARTANAPTVYECRRPNGALRFRCKACRKDFTVTSGTLFAFHKLPLRNYLAAIAIFCNEVKGKSALALSRDLDVQYKTAFVLAHKLREAMASELKGMHVGGEGETVEVDGGYFGGYVKPANYKENRRDRRLAKNQNGKRRVVVVVRERDGRTLPAVFKSEVGRAGLHRLPRGAGHPPDGRRSRRHGTTCMPAIAMDRIDHGEAYSLTGRRLHERRRGILLPDAPGRDRPPSPHRRGLSGPLRAGERMARGSSAAWTTAGRSGPSWGWRWLAGRSVDWCGYWQRARAT